MLKKQILLGALFVSVATGCATYRVVGFEDHASRNVTSMQVTKTKNLIFSKTSEHQFYLCKEDGTNFNCDVLCGGSTDLACPKVGQDGKSNIR